MNVVKSAVFLNVALEIGKERKRREIAVSYIVIALTFEREIKLCVSHRQPAADVSNEQEGVMFEVAHHGVAAPQLCGPTIPLMVIADAAIPHHGQNEREDPLVVKK